MTSSRLSELRVDGHGISNVDADTIPDRPDRAKIAGVAGAIVNNASIAGMIADPGISTYVAAKHGVIGLTKAAAKEYAAHGIRINALAPGLVETSMTKAWFHDPSIRRYFLANAPIGRVAQPEEMAGMVLFLCSDFAVFRHWSYVRHRRWLYRPLNVAVRSKPGC